MSSGHVLRVVAYVSGMLASLGLGAQEVRYRYDADGRLISQGPDEIGLAVEGFAPAYGAAGATVSIRGRGFDSTPSNNHVAFAGVDAIVETALPEMLIAKVPGLATTGPITVVVNGILATSLTDFVILPAGVDPNAIVGSSTMPLDGTYRPYSALAGRTYALSFNVALGVFVSTDLDASRCTGVDSAGLSYKLYGPGGALVTAGSLTASAPTLLAPKISMGGTHTLLLSAPNTWTCSISAQIDPTIKPDDSPIHFLTTLPFHKKRLVFDLANGAALGVATSDLVTSPKSGGLTLGFFGPSGEGVGSYACGYVGYGECQGQIVYRPAGTYTAVLSPYDSRTQTIDSQFWLTTYVDGGVLESGTRAHPVIEKPGQVIRYTFHGNVGDQVRLVETEKTLQGTGKQGDILTGRNPAGECIFDNNYYCSISGPISPYDFAPLRYEGVYTLYYMLKSTGAGAPTGSATLTMSEPVRVGLPAGSDHVDVATTVNAQQVIVPIDILQNEDVSISLTDVKSLPSPFYVNATLRRPDGSVAGSFSCGSAWGSCSVMLTHAPAGQYKLTIDRADQRTETFSARVWKVPFIDGGVFSVNSTRNISNTLPGQVTRFTVPATAGQLLHFYMNNVQLGAGANYLIVSGTNPAAGCFFDNNYYCNFQGNTGALYHAPVLRLTGDYTLLVSFGSNGNQAPTGTALLSLSASSAFAMGPGDTQNTIGIDYSGQTTRGSLTASEGDRFVIAVTDVTATESNYTDTRVYAPNGSQVTSFSCGGYGACTGPILNAKAGTYVVETSAANSRGNLFSAQLWKSTVVEGGSLTPGVPLTVPIERPGNVVRLTMTGKAGQSFRVSVSNPVLGTNGLYAELSGRSSDGACTFSNNYYCTINNITSGGAIVGPLAADTTRDLFFYITSNGKGAATGGATITLTPSN